MPGPGVRLRHADRGPGRRRRAGARRPRPPGAAGAPRPTRTPGSPAAGGAGVTPGATARDNPLRDPQDRRLPKVAGPCGMVIFGVTGDLSRKKLMPAIYDLANRGLLPPGFSLVGFARRDWADQDFAQVVHDSVKEHARTEFREEVWHQLAEGFRFVPGDFDDDQAFEHLRQTIEDLDRLRGTGGNHAFYLSIPPRFFGDVDRPAQGARAGRGHRGHLATGRGREAVRLRPRDRPGAERGPQRRLPAGVGVPHRPLPRQGDGPEHPGAALREHDVRADLERQLRRPRADHDGRGHRHRRPGRLLRRHRRRTRRHPEPPAAAARAHRDGGADLVRRPQPAHGEAEGPRVGRAAPPPRPRHRPRPVRRRAGPAASRSTATSTSPTSRTRRRPRRTPRSGSAIDNRRWSGVPFYLRTGKRLGRRVTEVAVQFKKAPHLPLPRTRRPRRSPTTRW